MGSWADGWSPHEPSSRESEAIEGSGRRACGPRDDGTAPDRPADPLTRPSPFCFRSVHYPYLPHRMTHHRNRLMSLRSAPLVSRSAIGLAAFALLSPLPAIAQLERPPESGGKIFSIGQPRMLHWSLGLSTGAWMEGPGSELLVRAEGGSVTRRGEPGRRFAGGRPRGLRRHARDTSGRRASERW